MTEKFEANYLAEYAQKSKNTSGRIKQEGECDIRTAYQRDRDRIIHSESFRKLKGKTQVFIVKDDSFRTRLTHTLELSQIARTIAKALRLNEDLVEAIALGHDLGHTCFGHSGEEVLHQISGNFKHNEQSLRIIDLLERKGKGLNLTYEVRDGILNHTGDGIPITLEGKLVKIVDRITYLCHDIQDSIAAGILSENCIPARIFKVLGKRHSERVNTFVQDMIRETSKQIENGNEVKVYQSPLVREIMIELREFMFDKVYNGEICTREKEKAKHIVISLFKYFVKNPQEICSKYFHLMQSDEIERIVMDYIAALTDSHAIELFKMKHIPSP